MNVLPWMKSGIGINLTGELLGTILEPSGGKTGDKTLFSRIFINNIGLRNVVPKQLGVRSCLDGIKAECGGKRLAYTFNG